MPVREARIDQLDFLLARGEIAGEFSSGCGKKHRKLGNVTLPERETDGGLECFLIF